MSLKRQVVHRVLMCSEDCIFSIGRGCLDILGLNTKGTYSQMSAGVLDIVLKNNRQEL